MADVIINYLNYQNNLYKLEITHSNPNENLRYVLLITDVNGYNESIDLGNLQQNISKSFSAKLYTTIISDSALAFNLYYYGKTLRDDTEEELILDQNTIILQNFTNFKTEYLTNISYTPVLMQETNNNYYCYLNEIKIQGLRGYYSNIVDYSIKVEIKATDEDETHYRVVTSWILIIPSTDDNNLLISNIDPRKKYDIKFTIMGYSYKKESGTENTGWTIDAETVTFNPYLTIIESIDFYSNILTIANETKIDETNEKVFGGITFGGKSNISEFKQPIFECYYPAYFYNGIYINKQPLNIGYYSGDSITIIRNQDIFGHITSGSKELWFTLCLGKPIYASTFEIVGRGIIRGVAGYIAQFQWSDNENKRGGSLSNHIITTYISDAQAGIICFSISRSNGSAFQKTDANNYNNNTPITMTTAEIPDNPLRIIFK